MYGPVRTVVWQGSAGDRRPYADQRKLSEPPVPKTGAGPRAARRFSLAPNNFVLCPSAQMRFVRYEISLVHARPLVGECLMPHFAR